MKLFSVLIEDTLFPNGPYGLQLIEHDNKKAFISRVLSFHETGRSDLGEEGRDHDRITDDEIAILKPRIENGKNTNLTHGITRYSYRFVTFNGSLVPGQ